MESAEDEAALLAELMAVSKKSSAADRFASSDDDNNPVETTSVSPSAAFSNDGHEVVKTCYPSEPDHVNIIQQPPDKTDVMTSNALSDPTAAVVGVEDAANAGGTTKPEVEFVSPPAPSSSSSPLSIKDENLSIDPTKELSTNITGSTTSSNFQHQPSSSFSGERGGDAFDAELLAELRGVSNKSSAGDRFAGGDGSEDDNIHTHTTSSQRTAIQMKAATVNTQSVETLTGKPRQTTSSSSSVSKSGDKPWKRANAATGAAATNPSKQAPSSEGDVDIVISAPRASTAVAATGSQARAEETTTPPARDEVVDVNDAIESTESVVTTIQPETVVPMEARLGGGGNFNTHSTFQGERGGDAHDPELLALLRGVSAKSAASRTFGDEDERPHINNGALSITLSTTFAAIETQVEAKPESSASEPSKPQRQTKSRSDGVPPWRRGSSTKKNMHANVDVEIAVASPKSKHMAALPADVSPPETESSQPERPNNSVIDPPASGISSDNFRQKSTFQGERGGDANDPELLALLRGVSARNKPNADVGEKDMQYQNQENTETKPDENDATVDRMAASESTVTSVAQYRAPETTTSSSSTMEIAASHMKDPAENDTAGEIQPGRGNFQQTSLFQGERGGDAHDPELLALLRQTGSKPPSVQMSAGQSPALPEGGDDEIIVQKEDLPVSFSDKNWKVRKAAYQLLTETLKEASKVNAVGTVESDSIFPGLDGIIPTILAEKNAVALEFAVQAATEYADVCKGASSAQQAEVLVESLIKGSAFSSPRPSCAKITSDLVLKLMEVGSDKMSLIVVTTHLLQNGLSSKKPKVVQLSTSLILDSAVSFGAALLPLKPIVDELPKILSHSNKKIRDTGLEILAEFCRALGSKAPLQPVIEKMQNAQVKDLDALLNKQPNATQTKIGLRCFSGSSKSHERDALAALQAGSEELERERYLARPAADVLEKLKTTEYSSKLKLAKWSEKVAALSIVIDCGGEKPYKLVQPSSSVNYTPLISDMKGLLKHTHFVVVNKALEVLGMLAEGVGEKLFPNLRPLLPQLLQLSKDKKLTKSVASCLDSFFGNVLSYENLVDADSAIFDAIDESKEKNALARTSALEFLDRAVKRGSSAGPRAVQTPHNSKLCAMLAATKLEDSDATVRKAALQILVSLQHVQDKRINETIISVVEQLQQSNPYAYKTLSKGGQPKSVSQGRPKSPTAKAQQEKSTPALTRTPAPIISASKTAVTMPSIQVVPTVARQDTKPFPFSAVVSDDGDLPSPDEAISHCQSLNIEKWDDAEDDGGVLSGLQSTKWQSRQAAIKVLAVFVGSRAVMEPSSDVERETTFLLVLVKEHTRGFNETNMNVTRSILELLISLCDYHERISWPFPKWAISDATRVAVEKISDRKLSALSKSLLLALNVIHPPPVVLKAACRHANALKAPVAHEEFLIWMKTYCNQFGAHSIGTALPDTVQYLIEECSSKNVKVKRAAFVILGLLHVQIGPPIKPVILAMVQDLSLRQEMDKLFIDNPFDPSLSKAEWPKTCLVLPTLCFDSGGEDNVNKAINGVVFDLPKTDLIAELPTDCLSKMGAKEGKTAWKLRKAALEDVEKVLMGSTGVLDTSKLRGMIDLLRAMRERLADSQSNLKPLAARLIGDILGSVEGDDQGKLGKIVYGPLINAAMNDNRKIMHDASIGALLRGTSIPSVVGEGVNEQSLEPFIVALSLQLEDSEYKSVGIAAVLSLAESLTPVFPNLDNITSNRGETLGGRFSRVLVDALSSSKVEIRSAAESLLSECLKRDIISLQTAKKCTGRLVPAKQRSVGMILAKIASIIKKNDLDTSVMDDEDNDMETRVALAASSKQTHVRDRPGTSNLINQPRPAAKVAETQSQRINASKVALRQQEYHASREEQDDVPRDSANPLVYESGPSGLQKSRAALRSLTWPEYPEEPTGASLYNGLKKAWAPLIPPESVKALFPDGGVRKQDDFMKGFEIITRAIVLEQAGEGMAVTEQLTFIFRWSIFVLCSRESTVGLAGLLEMLAELVHFLVQSKCELSDSDAMCFVPYVFEKASIAKGRFIDMYMDLIHSLKSGDLIPIKRLGPSVCVALMESSQQAKARLLACQECYACVEAANLSGIGKKGVIVAARNFSEEKLPENKAAFMDLMVLIASRMNNDTNRLAKICGSSLSSRARKSLEERILRGGETSSSIPSSTKVPSPSKSWTSEGMMHRSTSRLPGSNQSTPASHPPPSRFKGASDRDSSTDPSSFQDELPALDLRTELPKSPGFSRTPLRASAYETSQLPSSLPRLPHILSASDGRPSSRSEFQSTLTGRGTESGSYRNDVATNLFKSSNDLQSDLGTDDWRVLSSHSTGSSASNEASSGAAASLRARLLKIREKNKSTVPPATSQSSALSETMSQINAEFSALSAPLPQDHPIGIISSQTSAKDKKVSNGPVLHDILEMIQLLLDKVQPLNEEKDDDIIAVTNAMKNIHAAVTFQSQHALGLDPRQVEYIRQEIKENISDVITALTKILVFGFQCHPETVSAGISVGLVSVDLACLMAMFRANDIAELVNVEDLTILIRESVRALLDRRLAPPSKSDSLEKSTSVAPLAEATSAQLVRAINKLAVQCANGPKVETSVQALITLQEQLSLNNVSNEEQLFNSRMTRIVSKLFGRAIKTEESLPDGFSTERVDMETIICCLEDTLVKGNEGAKAGNREGAASTRNLARLLVVAMLQKRRESSFFRQTMEKLEIDPSSSPLGLLVQEVVTELNIPDHAADVPTEKAVPKVDVASLVSAVGSADNEKDRDAAISALKEYKVTHGDVDLNAHLAEVSSTFRSFVLEQLSRSSTRAVSASIATNARAAPSTTHGPTYEATHTSNPPILSGVINGSGTGPTTSTNPTSSSSSMSDRIKSLRSKLNATEAAMQKIDPGQQQKENKNDDQPSLKNDTAKAFRDRLAAAQEKQRLATTLMTSSSSGVSTTDGRPVGLVDSDGTAMSPVPQTSAGSRAAALRARLHAVKEKTTGEEF